MCFEFCKTEWSSDDGSNLREGRKVGTDAEPISRMVDISGGLWLAVSHNYMQAPISCHMSGGAADTHAIQDVHLLDHAKYHASRMALGPGFGNFKITWPLIGSYVCLPVTLRPCLSIHEELANYTGIRSFPPQFLLDFSYIVSLTALCLPCPNHLSVAKLPDYILWPAKSVFLAMGMYHNLCGTKIA